MNNKSQIHGSALIPLIIFIEGFCSLGAEIVALRRLVPHVGSAIVDFRAILTPVFHPILTPPVGV